MRFLSVVAILSAFSATGARAEEPNILDRLMKKSPGSIDIFPKFSDFMGKGLYNQPGSADAVVLGGELGGISFRGEKFDPKAYPGQNSKYLEPIMAKDLFKLLGNPKLEAWAQSKRLDPKDPATVKRFTQEVSGKLNQLFVLKSIAAMLDTDAHMKNQSLKVSDFRLEFAVRKILVLDNKLMNDVIFEDYLSNLIMTAVKAGPAEVSKLVAQGIPQEVVDLFLQKEPPKDKDPRQMLDQFKEKFDADLARQGAKSPFYAQLSPQMLARLKDLASPVRNSVELFERLKAKVGTEPYFFGVAWNEGKDDPELAALASKFTESWQPVVITGQNPMYGATDKFPQDLDAFYTYVESKLQPRHQASVRQKLANSWLFGHWRNRDLINPHPPKNPKRLSDLISPMSTLALSVSQQDMANAYEELKFEVAARDTSDFTIIEVKLGDFTHDVASGKVVATPSCAIAFNKAFEKPYTQKQKDILAELGDPKVTTARFDELISKAREEIAAASYRYALSEMRKITECADFPVKFERAKVDVDPAIKNLTEDEKARVRFIGLVAADQELARMMIPKKSRRDDRGNVYHYFFLSHRMMYMPYERGSAVSAEIKQSIHNELCAKDAKAIKANVKPADMKSSHRDILAECEGGNVHPGAATDTRVRLMIEETRRNVRDAVISRKLADRWIEAVNEQIQTRFSIGAMTEPFFFDGVAGFQLKKAVKEPQKWIPQIFMTSRMQKNPELMIERRIVEKGTKVFEGAYDIN